MEVNFDNLRLQTLNDYESLVRKLNDSIMPNDEYVDLGDGRSTNLKGYVVISAYDIQKVLDNLRMEIISIACCYNKEAEIEDVLPDREIISFNETEEEV